MTMRKLQSQLKIEEEATGGLITCCTGKQTEKLVILLVCVIGGVDVVVGWKLTFQPIERKVVGWP